MGWKVGLQMAQEMELSCTLQLGIDWGMHDPVVASMNLGEQSSQLVLEEQKRQLLGQERQSCSKQTRIMILNMVYNIIILQLETGSRHFLSNL